MSPLPTSLARTLSDSLAPVVDLVYPPRCPLCGDGLGAQEGLCLSCWSGLEVPTGEDDHAAAPVSAATLYNDTARKLVLAFKHGRKIALAPMLAKMMAARLPALDGDWLAVPVPLHRTRLWHRGYNQSALLARELSRATGARLLVDGLVRTRRTPSLGGLGRGARAQALSGAIAANERRIGELRGSQIVLVDDVLTSGATSNACVAALRQAGAKRVRIACFSRVPQ